MTTLAVGGPAGSPRAAEGQAALVRAAADAARTLVTTALAAPPGPGPGGVLAREALADSTVEARAAVAGADLLRWLDGDLRWPDGGAAAASDAARTAAAVALAWQVPRGVAATAAELAVALPATAPAATAALAELTDATTAAASGSPEAESDTDTAGFLVDGGGAAAALRVVATVAEEARESLPDLAEALDTAAGGLAAALPDEWTQPGPVRLAGLPYLLTPLGQLLCAAGLVRVAGAPGATPRAAVTARRYLYRHLRTVTPEGLTGRHLTRTEELLDEPWSA
jgi:hypothetical protein